MLLGFLFLFVSINRTTLNSTNSIFIFYDFVHFYFFFKFGNSYNSTKTWVQGGNTKKPLGPSLHMFCAANAGVLTLLMTNPIWVVKTRLCLQYRDDVYLAESKRYSGLSDALKKIYRTEGVRGLYKVNYFNLSKASQIITPV